MNVPISRIIPHALRLELERVEVRRGLVVRVCVREAVPATADVAADEANPEVDGGGAVGAGGEGGRGGVGEGDGDGGASVGGGGVGGEEGLGVSADGTANGEGKVL
jgi:hypothetical protein